MDNKTLTQKIALRDQLDETLIGIFEQIAQVEFEILRPETDVTTRAMWLRRLEGLFYDKHKALAQLSKLNREIHKPRFSLMRLFRKA